VANSLVAFGSAAVLSVYAAGYLKTRSAAERFHVQDAERRPAQSARPSTSTQGPASAERAGEIRQKPPLARVGSAAPAAWPPSQESPDAAAGGELGSAAFRRRRPAIGAGPSGAAPETSSATPFATPTAAPAGGEPTFLRPLPPPPPAPVAPPVVAAAPAVAEPAAPPAPPIVGPFRDGTYAGWGESRHGDIQATVVIEGGRIASAIISRCQTRYPCSLIEKLPPQVAERQSPEIDYVTGASESTNAFYYAVVEALSKAK
jgi:uncharacterized protein with FMN-binding domain